MDHLGLTISEEIHIFARRCFRYGFFAGLAVGGAAMGVVWVAMQWWAIR